MFVIARTRNKRPSLQHALNSRSAQFTLCGIHMYGWSRAYQHEAIPEILCYRCGKKLEK